MKNSQSHLRVGILIAVLAVASPWVPASPRQITGAAGSKFLVDATGEKEFALPALLLFDPSGCLIWTELGLDETTWKASLDHALSEKTGNACSVAMLPAALAQLAAEGVEIPKPDVDGRYILFWYGSEQLCPPCVQKKADIWPSLQASLPENLFTVLLDWKP